jgi:hypothetical protein
MTKRRRNQKRNRGMEHIVELALAVFSRRAHRCDLALAEGDGSGSVMTCEHSLIRLYTDAVLGFRRSVSFCVSSIAPIHSLSRTNPGAFPLSHSRRAACDSKDFIGNSLVHP